MRAHFPTPGDVKGRKGQHMKKVGIRRGVRALVLVASIVGVLTAGIATQAFASVPPPGPPALIGTGTAQNSSEQERRRDRLGS